MMDVFSRNTSDVIRYDFIKYNRRKCARDDATKKDTLDHEEYLRRSLEQFRSEMANDDGRGSYGTYKCPIF